MVEFPMITEEQQHVLWRAIEKYGKATQIDKAIEEMSELTKALLKDRHINPDERYDSDWAKNDVSEEMADVIIMLNQIVMIYDVYLGYDVQRQVDIKIERLADRLAEVQ